MESSWTDALNFPLILVIATFLSGVIWLIDAIAFAPKRRAAAGGTEGQQPILVEYARSFFPVLFVVLVLRSFLFEPFRIPSGSMIPTLLVGDYILVNKFAYGVRLPVVHTKILDTGSPKRGEVAVFRFPNDPSLDYIKRIVGVPGDTVAYRDKRLFINGEAVEVSGGEPYVSPETDAVVAGATRYEETLGEATHDILVFDQGFAADGVAEVPEGHYFVMGDNRDRSNDSRFWGVVPEENLVGKARFIWMHWNGGILWNRLGETIR